MTLVCVCVIVGNNKSHLTQTHSYRSINGYQWSIRYTHRPISWPALFHLSIYLFEFLESFEKYADSDTSTTKTVKHHYHGSDLIWCEGLLSDIGFRDVLFHPLIIFLVLVLFCYIVCACVCVQCIWLQSASSSVVLWRAIFVFISIFFRRWPLLWVHLITK